MPPRDHGSGQGRRGPELTGLVRVPEVKRPERMKRAAAETKRLPPPTPLCSCRMTVPGIPGLCAGLGGSVAWSACPCKSPAQKPPPPGKPSYTLRRHDESLSHLPLPRVSGSRDPPRSACASRAAIGEPGRENTVRARSGLRHRCLPSVPPSMKCSPCFRALSARGKV